MRTAAALFLAVVLAGCSTAPTAPVQAEPERSSVCKNSPQFCEKVSPEEWKRRRAAAGL